MINEELYVKSRMSQRDNPFRVPEGYFDSLAAEVMQKLPEQTSARRPLTVRMRPWLAAAACLVGVLFTATIYLLSPDGATQAPVTTTSAEDTYVEDVADYVMADNYDIYACLAGDY